MYYNAIECNNISELSENTVYQNIVDIDLINHKKNEQNINIRGVSALYQNDSEFNQTDYTNDVETNASPLDDTSVEIRETNVAELKDAKEHIEIRKSRYHELVETWDNQKIWPEMSSFSRTNSTNTCSKYACIITGMFLLVVGLASYLVVIHVSNKGILDTFIYKTEDEIFGLVIFSDY